MTDLDIIYCFRDRDSRRERLSPESLAAQTNQRWIFEHTKLARKCLEQFDIAENCEVSGRIQCKNIFEIVIEKGCIVADHKHLVCNPYTKAQVK